MDIFLEFYCSKQFHPVHKQILNRCLCGITATNSRGERYIMQPLQNQNLELVLAVVLKTGTAAVLLGTLCFFVFCFFPPFSMAVTDAENRKKIGRGPGSYPVHMLHYATRTCSPRSIVKSKTHDIVCFRTFSPIGDIPVGWEETIPSSWCEASNLKKK